MKNYLEQPTVIKIGGSTLEEEDVTLKSLAKLYQQAHPLVVVHGGGPEIDKDLEELGIKPIKVNGQRVTDPETLIVVVKRLDLINKRLTSKLTSYGVKVCESGPFSSLLEGEIPNPSLGYVGRVTAVKADLINQRLQQGEIPIISPIAQAIQHPHSLLNINGDLASSAVAIALGANVIFLTNVPGVLDKNGELIRDLTGSAFNQMYKQGAVSSGMIPKLEAAFNVSSAGGRTLICHHTNLASAFGGNFLGTEVKI
ncbi:MAG: acetylglutamate kinase [Sphingobacteriales bacterium]|nr:acetylglutamate kinase [Sphingobacteriales bacterium]MBI3486120.1 acetylglutamate kinase [Candidatus Daviesbacteria bacterium]